MKAKKELREETYPETREAIERWHQGKINIFDEMSRLEKERNESREEVQVWKDQYRKIWKENRILKK